MFRKKLIKEAQHLYTKKSHSLKIIKEGLNKRQDNSHIWMKRLNIITITIIV